MGESQDENAARSTKIDLESLTLADLKRVQNPAIRSAIDEILRSIDLDGTTIKHHNHMSFSSHMKSTILERTIVDEPFTGPERS